jgi:ATP-dependent Clp protease ATP-binding subunit ClpA
MFERFTDRARKSLVLAEQEVRELHHLAIGTEHLLLGLLSEGDGVAGRVLAESGITLEAARKKVSSMMPADPEAKAVNRPPFTPRAKKTLELSLREALRLRHNYIGTEHLLLGLIREDGGGAQVLRALGGNAAAVQAQIEEVLEGFRAEQGAGGKDQPLRRRLWPRGIVPSDLPQSSPGTVEISYGKFSQIIADPELAAALSQIAPEQLHANLRAAVLGTGTTGADSE